MKHLPSEYRKSDNPGVKPGEIRNPLGRAAHEQKILAKYSQIEHLPNSIEKIKLENALLAEVILNFYMQRGEPKMRVDLAKHVSRNTGTDILGFTKSGHFDSKTLIMAFIQYQTGKSDGVEPPVTIEHVK